MMANLIEEVNTSAGNFVVPTSRYLKSEVIRYSESKFMTFKIYKKGKESQSSSNDRFTVITKSSEFRPDKISQQAYNTPDYWWKIMEANGLKDIMEFKSGLNIRIPNTLF